MKVRVVFLACVVGSVLSCGPATFTIRPGALTETRESVECPRPRWGFDVYVDENETVSSLLPQENAVYEFKSGEYLRQLAQIYLRPCLNQVPQDEESLPFISVYTSGLRVERVRGPGLLSADRIQVRVTLGVNVYYDSVILYWFQVEGQGAAPVSLHNERSAQRAGDEAYTEAVKKIPARLAEALSDLERAKAEVRKEIEQQLKSGAPLHIVQGRFVSLANLCRLTRAYPEAIAAAEKAIELNPKWVAAYEVLGLVHRDRGDWREAKRNLMKALEIEPHRSVTGHLLGRLYLSAERYEEAAQVFSKLRATALMGLPSLHLGRFEEAVRHDTQFVQNSTAGGIGARLEAAKDFLIVTEVEPSGPAERAGLRGGDRVLKVNGEPTQGWDMERISRAISGEAGSEVVLTVERSGWDKPQDVRVTRGSTTPHRLLPWVLARRAFAYRAMGKREEFLKDAERAYVLGPNSAWAKAAKAVALLDQGRPQEALDVLKEVPVGSFFGLLDALAWAKAGDMSRAVAVYSRVSEDVLSSRSVLLRVYLDELHALMKPYKESLLQAARQQEQKGLYRDALRGYADYLKLADEKEARALRNHIADLMARQPHLFALSEEARKAVIRAEAYTSEGRFDKAIEEYKGALKLSPFFPGLYKALAYSYAQLKDYRKAIRNLQIYLELYPDAPDARVAKDEMYKWDFMMQRED